MGPRILRLFTFVTFFALLFTSTILAVAIPNPDSAPAAFSDDLEASVNPFFEVQQSGSCPPDCGSSPFQQPCRPCNSASSLHLPFRSFFKLPALIFNMAAIGTIQVQAAAVVPQPVAKFIKRLGAREAAPAPIPGIDETKEQDDEELIVRDGCGWHNGFEQFPCSAASGIQVPSIFTIPALLFTTLTTKHARAAAVPVDSRDAASIPIATTHGSEERDDDEVVTENDLIARQDCNEIRGVWVGCPQGPPTLWSAANSLKVHPVLAIPSRLLNALTAILDTPSIHGVDFLVQKRGFTDGAGASKGEMSTEAFWDQATNVGLSGAGVWAGALCAGLGFAWLVL